MKLTFFLTIGCCTTLCFKGLAASAQFAPSPCVGDTLTLPLASQYEYDFKRFYFSLSGLTSMSSQAITNAPGLQNELPQKWHFGAKLGFWFWLPGRLSFAIESGAAYRDFGFRKNQSSIPYLAVPALVRLNAGRQGRFINVTMFGGVEFNRLLAHRYQYVEPGNPANHQFNLFLHENDAITGIYGAGFIFGKKGFKLEIFTETIVQIDKYDLQFGKTIGGRTLGGALRLHLF